MTEPTRIGSRVIDRDGGFEVGRHQDTVTLSFDDAERLFPMLIEEEHP